MITDCRRIQPWNALPSMLVTLTEIVTVFKLVQLAKAFAPIPTTPSPIVTSLITA